MVYDNLNKLLSLTLKQKAILDPSTSLNNYRLNCHGLKTPDGMIVDGLKISWVDGANNNAEI